MNSFSVKTAGFLVFLAIINFSLHFGFLHIVYTNSIVQRRAREFFKKADKQIEILFLGDSHVNAVQEDRIPNAVKFDSFGENYIQSYYKLQYLIDREDMTIKNLVLPFDLHSFSSFRSDRIINDIYWTKYMDYFELARAKNDRTYILKWMIAHFCAYAGKGDEILEYLQKVRGFPSLREKQKEDVKNRVYYHFKNQEIFDRDILYYFKKILNLCSEKEINIILIKYPLSRSYLINAADYVDRNEFYGYLHAILADFPHLNYDIWDYQEIFVDSPVYFMDSDHLNRKGAIAFSELLSKKFSGHRNEYMGKN